MKRSWRWMVPTGLLLMVLVWQMPAAPAQSEAPKRLSVMAYNMENFFDVFDDPYTEDEQTSVKPRREITALAQLLREMDADVIAVSEVENDEVLKAMLVETLGDMGYNYVAVPKSNSGRGIKLGVISRVPIESVTSHRFQTLTLPGEERTWRFARDLVKVRIEPSEGRFIDLYAVHFKSRRDSRGDPNSSKWRLAEATRAAQIIGRQIEADPDAMVLMLGDFNDTPDTETLEVLAGEDAPLVDLHAEIPAEQRITYLREPYRSTIDYMLASPEMARRLIPTSPRIVQDEDLLTGSDHAPVYAAFDLSK